MLRLDPGKWLSPSPSKMKKTKIVSDQNRTAKAISSAEETNATDLVAERQAFFDQREPDPSGASRYQHCPGHLGEIRGSSRVRRGKKSPK
jgi:hypothetical protein